MKYQPGNRQSNKGMPPKSPSWMGSASPEKSLKMSLFETLKLAWADPEIRQRLMFILFVFAVYTLGVHVPVPIPGFSADAIENLVKNNPFFQLIDTFGGGGLKRLSIFALGLNPYITSSIVMQVLTATTPSWKKELQEGGEYARAQQNKRIRFLTLGLCLFQGWGMIQMLGPAFADISIWTKLATVLFWTTGSMFILWLGEQVSEKGIGNGISLMIFAGIIISMPGMIQVLIRGLQDGVVHWLQVGFLGVIFVLTTWFVVTFTIAQRRIPIQHMRRQMGAKMGGGSTSYLPLSLNLAGVIPIIFAVALVYMPAQFAAMFPVDSTMHSILNTIATFLRPDFSRPEGLLGCLVYSMMIFFFTYFYTAIQYNVEDISNNLKRGGSFIPGIRPGKQTKDFLDGVITRLTLVGAFFLAIIALSQYFVPLIVSGIPSIGLLFGTSLLIMVSVALETMRQIEANILMKQYGHQG